MNDYLCTLVDDYNATALRFLSARRTGNPGEGGELRLFEAFLEKTDQEAWFQFSVPNVGRVKFKVKVKVFTYIALFRSLPTRILIKGALQ